MKRGLSERQREVQEAQGRGCAMEGRVGQLEEQLEKARAVERRVMEVLGAQDEEIRAARGRMQELEDARTAASERASRLAETLAMQEDASRRDKEELGHCIARLDSQAKALESEANAAREESEGLRNVVKRHGAALEDIKKEGAKEMEEAHKIKNRWAATAKELGQQLELRAAEVKRMEDRLADSIRAKEQERARAGELERKLEAADALIQHQRSIIDQSMESNAELHRRVVGSASHCAAGQPNEPSKLPEGDFPIISHVAQTTNPGVHLDLPPSACLANKEQASSSQSELSEGLKRRPEANQAGAAAQPAVGGAPPAPPSGALAQGGGPVLAGEDSALEAALKKLRGVGVPLTSET
ncbi:unnamed protein product [Ostreobium quekettii]|uniref:Uncharacterized protein n=1 Tax=Ostreobium quekettii TaxID=121088 RepID=A0A8S1J3R2_9CHLO|nr:unnamed protein product [Ostreobium quekettii]|eukprot:evm.model.scf_686.3 EVM.evm.TU.scf_686.3   scf_686:54862-59614(-)